MIVVTTPTGQIGRHVVRDLLAAGAPVRVIVRDPARLPAEVRDRVEIVEGSHGDAAIVDRAFEGADALFWVTPPDVRRTLDEVYLDFVRPAVDALRRHRVERVVSVTALGRGTAWADRAGLVTASIRMDDLLMASGVAFRGLAMPSFMDNVVRQAATIRDAGALFGPIDPDKRLPTVAVRDIGAVAAGLLADDAWTGQAETPLLGPEDLSFADMAAVITDVLGRAVRYQQTSFDAFKAQWLGRGASESFAQGYVDMMRAKNEGVDNAARRTPERATPTTFRQWCDEELRPAVLR